LFLTIGILLGCTYREQAIFAFFYVDIGLQGLLTEKNPQSRKSLDSLILAG
jgi:hypothetical protein